MMPIYPARAFVTLTEQSLRRARRQDQAMHAESLDHFLDYEALTPDPMFMSLRQLVHTGPIGILLRRIDRWIERREARRMTPNVSHAQYREAPEPVIRADSTLENTDDRSERIAA